MTARKWLQIKRHVEATLGQFPMLSLVTQFAQVVFISPQINWPAPVPRWKADAMYSQSYEKVLEESAKRKVAMVSHPLHLCLSLFPPISNPFSPHHNTLHAYLSALTKTEI